jgi:CheY-like chemotaxis protein
VPREAKLDHPDGRAPIPSPCSTPRAGGSKRRVHPIGSTQDPASRRRWPVEAARLGSGWAHSRGGEVTIKTILIADDHDYLRLLVRTTLESPGYRIIEASDGREALQLATEEHPDLMILDWMLPEMSGIEVLDALRSNTETSALPVIMLTAKAQSVDRNQAIMKGIRGYLTKPFSPLELVDRVEKALKPLSELA